MTRSVYLTTLVLFGCATGSASLPSATTRTRTTVETASGKYTVEQVTTPDVLKHTVPASLEDAWAALPAAYGDLRIPVNAVDPQSHIIGSGDITAQGSFAGTRVSRFLDCGEGALGTQNADHYEVHLNVRTQLTANASGGTLVQTLIEASARDAGTATSAVHCATTGTLERRIAEALAKEAK
ncbi:MAG TPA: hypothetical protein VF166_11370 [Gemmatimonadaceae bacterium]